jgi:hypothetical protein
MNGEAILDLPMGENDAGADTIRDYLKRLLFEVWSKNEGFSGKRPFGNSGWEYELYHALIEGGASFAGSINEDGDVEVDDSDELDTLIFDAIEAL